MQQRQLPRAGRFQIFRRRTTARTPGFLARLKDVKTPIRPISGCSTSADQGVVDKKTHARGLSFRVEGITFKDARHAKVIGGYYEAGLSASGNVYTVERKACPTFGRACLVSHEANGWVVTKDEMMWIS